MQVCPPVASRDLEAAPTMQMLLDKGERSSLVVASAGNTARAFAHIASLTGQEPGLICSGKSSGKNVDDCTTRENNSDRSQRRLP